MLLGWGLFPIVWWFRAWLKGTTGGKVQQRITERRVLGCQQERQARPFYFLFMRLTEVVRKQVDIILSVA